MTISQLMEGKNPSAAFEGFATSDDMVLAVDFGKTGEVGQYLVAQMGITQHAGALNPETADSQYLRSGKATTKTGNQRVFAVEGDRYCGDAFQDALLTHEMKYGTGQAVIRDYVYFNLLTGAGEKGTVSVLVEDELGGEAGENASFTASLSAVGAVSPYTFAG